MEESITEVEAGVEPQLEVEAVQKTKSYEQCEADDHVTDNTSLECDPDRLQ